MGLNKLYERLLVVKGKYQQAENDLSEAIKKSKMVEKELKEYDQVRKVVQSCAEEIQNRIKININSVATLAMSYVFPQNKYKFDLNFIPKRGKTECVISFDRDGNKITPKKGSGIGVVDVAAFASQCAILKMAVGNPRQLLIMDEPFKHIKGQQANKAAIKITHKISRSHNIQMIMVSDERVPISEIEKGADNVIEI